MLVAVMPPTNASTPRPSPGRAKVTEATAEVKRNHRVPWTIEALEQLEQLANKDCPSARLLKGWASPKKRSGCAMVASAFQIGLTLPV